DYLRKQADSRRPFFMVLAWGPPHDPYFTAPEKYRQLYEANKVSVRANVPEKERANAQKILAGYYAHCTALDDCIGVLRQTLEATGLLTNTIIVFTSDHGDMLGSHGLYKKQKPYDESIRVPLLFRLPASPLQSIRPRIRTAAPVVESPIGSEDLMPTILGLCGLAVPKTAEGPDFSGCIRGEKPYRDGAAMVMGLAPFGE